MTNATTMIIKTLKENKGAFIDTHNDNEIMETTSIGYVILENSKRTREFVCPIYRNTFCLNPLYIEDGVVKLGTMSVGGVLKLKLVCDTDDVTYSKMIKILIESEIDRYNEIHKDGNECGATHQMITSYEFINK